MELHFAETEPMVGVKFARLLELMAEQIEHDDPPAALQYSVRRRDRFLRIDRVVQCLAEDCEIDAVPLDRRIFDFAQAVFEILETVFFRESRTELDHLRRIIDRDDFTRVFCEQLRERSFASAQIRDREWRQQA